MKLMIPYMCIVHKVQNIQYFTKDGHILKRLIAFFYFLIVEHCIVFSFACT